VSDRAVRNLLALQDSASTSRVLNLVAIWNKNRTDPDYNAKPFFNSNILNKTIIIKHKLRSNEMDLFGDDRSTGTKILVPIDSNDLKLGGRFVFINQKNFEAIAQSTFGVSFSGDNRDRAVLDLLDATPSLDPFLLREQMKRFGIYPADCYFEISKADVDRMHNFVAREVNALVSKSFGAGGGNFSKSNKLVSKILSSTADEDLDPLRINLQMKPSEFSEGLFCWRGFLYYKWCHFSSIPKVNSAMKQMIKYQPAGPMDNETRDNLVKVRASLARNIVKIIGDIEETLKRYDDAYAGLTSNNEPQAFRQFLLTAPSMFKELGERLGVVSHIISYWGFRFPVGKEPAIAATEILRIFSDFDENLSFSGSATEVTW
jgi:hypothetical protein